MWHLRNHEVNKPGDGQVITLYHTVGLHLETVSFALPGHPPHNLIQHPANLVQSSTIRNDFQAIEQRAKFRRGFVLHDVILRESDLSRVAFVDHHHAFVQSEGGSSLELTKR